jgi:hypothetical protein
LLNLHAHGAACAGLLGVELTSVRSTKAASNADPLAHTKDWLRVHGRGARRVLQTTLRKQVMTCSDAAATLELQAAGQLGASDARAPCIVIARNGDEAYKSENRCRQVPLIDSIDQRTERGHSPRVISAPPFTFVFFFNLIIVEGG